MHKNHKSCMYIFQIIPLVTYVNAIWCPLCKLNTVKAIWLKLQTLEEQNERMCHAQEPHLCFRYFWKYFSLIICNAISCPLCKLTTIKAIQMKLHQVVKHIKTMCHAQEPIHWLCIFWSNHLECSVSFAHQYM